MAIHAVEVPTSEPAADTAPKRGRGRPRKEGSDTAPRTRRSSAPAVTEDAVGGTLFMANMLLTMLPWTRGDALEPDEITALAKGIVEQAKTSPAFKRYVQYALRVSGASGVLTPLSLVLARRGIRHGWLPGGEDADAQIATLIGVIAGTRSLGDMMPPSFGESGVPTEPIASPVPAAEGG